MIISEKTIQDFLMAKTSPKETVKLLEAIALDPTLEEYVVSYKRAMYAREQMEDYDGFIPAGSMAGDNDTDNMCDFQCESKILELAHMEIDKSTLECVSKRNYWLSNLGTPLFNMGKLLENSGFLVNRRYEVKPNELCSILAEHYVITVVNGDVLSGRNQDLFSEDFSLENNPNHAVLVLEIDEEKQLISIYNPACGDEPVNYPYNLFVDAWSESNYYTVTARLKLYPEEYNPQPVDVKNISLNPELVELTDFIAENAHDVWAKDKIEAGYSYAPVDDKNHNHYLKPFSMLTDKEKEPDRKMALNTIKLVKRMGYRLVNINSMYKCPDCGEVIEPSNNFCPNCGKKLSWENFR